MSITMHGSENVKFTCRQLSKRTRNALSNLQRNARAVRKFVECLAYVDVLNQIWLSLIHWTAQFWTVGLQFHGLGRLPRTYWPKYAVVVTCAVTDCSQLFASPFQFYIMPDWRVKFLKSRRQCVISQRRMRMEGESRGLQQPRHERRGLSNVCHQRE